MKTEREERELIRQVLSGDHEAYSRLYDRTIGDVYKTVRFLVRNASDADDIVQNTYLEAYRSLSSFDPSRAFGPWLMGVAIRQIRAYRRKGWLHMRREKRAEALEERKQNDFTESLVNKLANEPLLQAIDTLPFKLKQVIVLHYLHEYSQEETAAVLRIPVGTVKSRTHAALQKLRQHGQPARLLIERTGEAK